MAVRKKTTFTAIIETALRMWLKETRRVERTRVKLPSSGKGGLCPGIDLDSGSSLLDMMEDS